MNGDYLVPSTISLSAARQLIEDEAAFLDERRWQDWIALFAPDCEYWVPTWKADGTLASNPQTELSYIYYGSRAGLEDRLVRIASPASPAGQPMPRTTHMLGYSRLIGTPSTDRARIRSSWSTHVFFPGSNVIGHNFGQYEHEVALQDGDLKISRKKTIIQNDYMQSTIDIYCI